MRENCRASCKECIAFSGDLSDPRYKRSPEYINLVDLTWQGTFEVPVLFNVMLIDKATMSILIAVLDSCSLFIRPFLFFLIPLLVLLQALDEYFTESTSKVVASWSLDIVVSQLLRLKNVPLFVSNEHDFGHLVNLEEFSADKVSKHT
jgi:hypothetical protein